MILLALLGFVGGLITGISPCVIPVLPVIFFSGGVQSATASGAADDAPPTARLAGRTRPYVVILGLVLSFSLFTLLGTLILTALHLPQDLIRWSGLIVLVLIGIGLIVPRVEGWLEKAFSWLPQREVGTEGNGFVLGLALGAVYVPCAGPVLAAITVAGVTGEVNAGTLLLTLTFAIGTAIPLLLFALAGRGIGKRIKTFRTHQRAIRVTAGIVMIVLAVALVVDLPQRLQVLIPDYTSALQNLAGGSGAVKAQLGPNSGDTGSASRPADSTCAEGVSTLVDCGQAPAIAGIASWLNTPGGAPISVQSLKGTVVLIDFWAYSCINCQRATPHFIAWDAAYSKTGFTVIGVHSPEYAFEHVKANVVEGAKAAGITFPVALDNDFTTWNNYGNSYWPAQYLIDANGDIRHVSFGEGGYSETEQLIRSLLTAANPGVSLPSATEVRDTTPTNPQLTAETYLDPTRASSYGGDGTFANGVSTYAFPATLAADSFALKGSWAANDEGITAGVAGASIRLKFDARHVYLNVGGTGTLTVRHNGTTRRIAISGAPNIHDLISAKSAARGTLDVELSPGLEAHEFTFG